MLSRVPVVAILLGLFALAMLIPAVHAASESEWRHGRGFMYASIFGLFCAGAIGTLLRPMRARETADHELLTLLMLWLILPVYAALPLILLTPALGLIGAWFEMVAAFTTTGGTAFTDLTVVPDAVHLWRGLVGWFGGLLTLLAAFVVLAPRRLGGFEVLTAAQGSVEGRPVDLRIVGASFESRTRRALRTVLPVYGLMTAALATAFGAFDKSGLVASMHAMSVISTSGISPLQDGMAASRSIGIEALALIFMVAAASRLLYADATQKGAQNRWRSDPELRLMLALALAATVVLFLRHWAGALTISAEGEQPDGLVALWGAAFTALSFVTTTGFVSFGWDSARDWSGLANPGLILLCLCIIGGGAASTAGGIKLIRAHALMRHGARELERIAVPHSIGRADFSARGLRREGAFIAWTFMMLFILALLLTMLGLAFTGMRFPEALIAAVAALSNTGPAYAVIADKAQSFALLEPTQHVILAGAMIVGRIEILAIIALFNPDMWRGGSAGSKKTGKSGSKGSISGW